MTAYWVGVVSRDHVRGAVEGGFCQLNHGKEAPVKRLQRGDRILYYSPRESLDEGAPVQAFTAIGVVLDDEPFAVQRAIASMSGQAFRRAVRYFAMKEDVPIKPLLPRLSFAGEKQNWGLVLRRGTFSILASDYRLIAAAAGVDLEPGKTAQ